MRNSRMVRSPDLTVAEQGFYHLAFGATSFMKVKFLISAFAFLAISLAGAKTASARKVDIGVDKQVAISYVGGFGGAFIGVMIGSGLVY